MGKMITGSLCLTDILARAKEGHSAFSKGANGKIYFNVLQWENDERDKYGNDFSMQLNAAKDAPEVERGLYIGNLKRVEAQGPSPIENADIADLPAEDDLPF